MTPDRPGQRRPAFDWTLPLSPYPGLRAFEGDEWPIFFGRETMTADVIERVVRQRFVLVHGDSAAGKSSLIRAGVLPRLEQELARGDLSWRTVVMSPRNAPLLNLAAALAGLGGGGDEARVIDILRILGLGRRAAPLLARHLQTNARNNICILVDQFEELFETARMNESSEARIFVDVLVGLEAAATTLAADGAAGEPLAPGLYVICTMRSEYFGGCAQYPGLAETANRTQYLVPRMDRAALTRAIRSPAQLYGGEVRLDLAERLIVDAGEGQDRLPLIQHALAELYRRKRAAHHGAGHGDTDALWTLSLEDLPESGGTTRLLSDHADRVLDAAIANSSDAGSREVREGIVARIFKALTDVNADGRAIRRPQTLRQLAAVAGVGGDDLQALLSPFRDRSASFLRPYGDGPLEGETLVDVSHEALIRSWGRIADQSSGWLQEEVSDWLIWKSLLVQAESYAANADAILSPAAARERSDWTADHGPEWARRYIANSSFDSAPVAWAAVEALLVASRRSAAEAVEREEERRDARVRMQRARTRTAIAFSVVALALVAVASWQFLEARAAAGASDLAAATATLQRQTALTNEARALTALSGLELAQSPTLALKLALAAGPRSADDTYPRLPVALEAFRNALPEAMERRVFAGHTASVRALAFTPDGSRLATASDDSSARLWDVTTGAEIALMSGHSGPVMSVGFSADGHRLVTASADGTARVWDARTGAEIATLRGHQLALTSASFSPDGTLVVTTSLDGTARLWGAANWTEVAVLRGHGGSVVSAVFSADGSRIVTASSDRTARLWNTATRAEIAVLRGHELALTGAKFSPDGTTVLTGALDRTARLWDAATGAPIAVLRGHEAAVTDASFSPNGALVVTASTDGTARVWTASGSAAGVMRGHEGSVKTASFSPDGASVVTASDDGTARLWDARSGAEITMLRGHDGPVNAAVFAPDARQLATASQDHTARMWQPAWAPEIGRLAMGEPLADASFSPDGLFVLATPGPSRPDGRVDEPAGPPRLFSTATGALVATLGETSGSAIPGSFSPDSTRVVIISGDGTARVWETSTGLPVTELRGDGFRILAVAFSPDGRRVATGCSDGAARLWDATTGSEIAVLRQPGPVGVVVFSPDGAYIATASADNAARIWTASTGGEIAVFRGHDGPVTDIAFSPDGRQIATASGDGTARIWDAVSWAERSILTGDAALFAVSFSPNGDAVLTMSDDGTIRLREVGTAIETTVIHGEAGSPVTAASLSSDGQRIVTASADRTARVWDAATGAELATLRGHEAAVVSAYFSPDGKTVLTASADGTARLWTTADLWGLTAFQLACHRLPDFDLTAIEQRYGLAIARPICFPG